MSANTETTGAKCKAPTWCDFDDDEDAGDSRLDVYVKARDGIYGVVSKEGRRYCTPACRDARLPPIAAPVAHAERRKGQVWRYQYKNETPREYVLEQHHLGGTGDWPSSGWSLVGREWGWFDSAWSTEDITMTLLADAPPEAAKPKSWLTLVMEDAAECGDGCAGSKFCPRHLAMYNREAKRKTCGCYPDEDCQACRQAAPAQEAPKAAPMCCDPFRNSVHHVEVLKRTWKTVHPGGVWTLRTDWLCSLCLSENEPGGGGSDVLHNDDVPERLPRPQLAADWVEDCLPEGGR